MAENILSELLRVPVHRSLGRSGPVPESPTEECKEAHELTIFALAISKPFHCDKRCAQCASIAIL